MPGRATPAERAALDEARRAVELAREAKASSDRVLSLLSTLVEGAVKPGASDDPAGQHRRAHRPGSLSRIESDPELRTFILARLDRLTFDQVIADVVAAFPPDRRTSRSALNRWWHRHGKQLLVQVAARPPVPQSANII